MLQRFQGIRQPMSLLRQLVPQESGDGDESDSQMARWQGVCGANKGVLHKRSGYLATLRHVGFSFCEFFANMTRHCQMVLDGQIEYGEVQFYFFQFTTNDPPGEETTTAHALVSVYTHPLQALLIESSNTLWACQYTGVDDLRVVPLSSIDACVSVQPLPPLPDDPPGLWFILE